MEKIELPEITKKSLLVVKLCNLLLAEEMDNIKNTTAYSRRIKQLVNNISDQLDKEYSETYSLYMDEDQALGGINYTLTALEGIADKIANMKTADELITFNEQIKTL